MNGYKLSNSGKVEPHEIASKTQMFTERYMVDWLLQNSLGPMWLAMCRKHGWTPDFEAEGTLDALEQRRVEWRAQRDERQAALSRSFLPERTVPGRSFLPERTSQPVATCDQNELTEEQSGDVESTPDPGQFELRSKVLPGREDLPNEDDLPGVSLTALMPLHTDAERRWAYYVPQPIPEDAIEHAPNSVRDLKILDPAVGSGHFLVVAFDLLFALYKEEARHRAAASPTSLLPHIGGEGARRADEGGSAAVRVAENPPHPALSPAGEIQDVASRARGRGDRTVFNPDDYTDAAITERILEHNLHGIDLDPRAVQIAAAALWLKAQTVCPAAQPKNLNLVASNLGITALADDDPALVELRRVVEDETGVPAALTNQIIEALRGADHLGSLLKVDVAIETAIAAYEEQIGWKNKVVQLTFDEDGKTVRTPRPISREWATTGILSAFENFLSRHTSAQELGLRLAGEQLAAGVRFVRMVREGTYDLVVANPPYQGTSKMADAAYVAEHYAFGKADLFAAFLLRGLQLVREHGVSGMLTMRNWMFIKQYSDLRQHLLETFDLRALGDFAVGAFDEVPNDVLSVVVSVFHRTPPRKTNSVAQQPTPPGDTSYDRQRTKRKQAATLCHIGHHTFDPAALKVVPEWPLVYWWDNNKRAEYSTAIKIGAAFPVKVGLQTSDDVRFLRFPWEPNHGDVFLKQGGEPRTEDVPWVPFVKGGKGRAWIEPVSFVVRWLDAGLEVQSFESSYPRNPEFYFRRGIAFTTMGTEFKARSHRFLSIFGDKGRSVFPDLVEALLCWMNSSDAREIMAALNPTQDFQVGDVERLHVKVVANADVIISSIDHRFGIHESHREPSVEFKHPGPTSWRHAQEWAQVAVDRPEGAPLPEYEPQLDPEPPTDYLSFALGVALGRFGANGEGILDGDLTWRAGGVNPPRNRGQGDQRDQRDENTLGGLTPSARREQGILPAGILFLDGTLGPNELTDGLGHPAAKPLLDAWTTHGTNIAPKSNLRDYLREKFFGDVHRQMYENRPIHWPLTSARKTFVAWINIHRWNARTLTHLLATLQNMFRRIEGELNDMRKAADGKDATSARSARDHIDETRAWKDELETFIALVQQCADKGPLSPEVAPGKVPCPPREVDAPYDPNLDDGVMINSAALWPLLDPVWRDPKKWWDELCRANPQGNKDYDWSHLAMKYWPTRVDKKCQIDPSLAVAHGCFWKYHPAKAWKWELRLQDEIGPDFRIEEAPYSPFSPSGEKVAEDRMRGLVAESQTPHSSPLTLKGRGDNTGGNAEYRTAYLAAQPQEALDAVEKELMRRRGKGDDIKTVSEMTLLESGLWTALPEVCWEIESKFIKKQKASFALKAPDEAVARKALLKADPALKKSRRELLAKIAPHDPFAAVGVMGEES